MNGYHLLTILVLTGLMTHYNHKLTRKLCTWGCAVYLAHKQIKVNASHELFTMKSHLVVSVVFHLGWLQVLLYLGGLK